VATRLEYLRAPGIDTYDLDVSGRGAAFRADFEAVIRTEVARSHANDKGPTPVHDHSSRKAVQKTANLISESWRSCDRGKMMGAAERESAASNHLVANPLPRRERSSFREAQSRPSDQNFINDPFCNAAPRPFQKSIRRF
jgi:hypothetical protein